MWKSCSKYWIHLAKQGSPGWLKARIRLTSSKFGESAGLSKFVTPDQLADEYNGKLIRNNNENMIHGNVTEPDAKKWYINFKSQGLEKPIVIEEVGLIVPKFDYRIGTSPDGMIGDDETGGVIETKCPKKLYYNLIIHLEKLDNGWKPEPGDYSHINSCHYAQMQGTMAITGRKWCDYVVYATETNMVYLEKIPFNEEYWIRLYLILVNFLNTKIKDLLITNPGKEEIEEDSDIEKVNSKT